MTTPDVVELRVTDLDYVVNGIDYNYGTSSLSSSSSLADLVDYGFNLDVTDITSVVVQGAGGVGGDAATLEGSTLAQVLAASGSAIDKAFVDALGVDAATLEGSTLAQVLAASGSGSGSVTFPHLKDSDGGWSDAIQAAFGAGNIALGGTIYVAAHHEGSSRGDGWYNVVAPATGTDDGGSYIDFTGFQLEAIFTDGIRNVHRFGAVGDGTTDDATAIQAALNAGIGVVWFEALTYLVNTSLTVPSYVRLEGVGGDHEVTPGKHVWGLPSETTLIRAGAAMTELIHFTDTGRCVGSGAHRMGFDGDELCSDTIVKFSAYNNRLSDCYVVHPPAGGSCMQTNKGVSMHETIVERCIFASNGKGGGIENLGPDNAYYGNVIKGCTEYGVKSIYNLKFFHNHLYAYPVEGYLMAKGVWLVGAQESMIMGNYFDDFGLGPMMYLEPGDTVGQYTNNTKVIGNTFNSFGDNGASLTSAIYIDNDKHGWDRPGVYGTIINGNSFESIDPATSWTSIVNNDGQHNSVIFTNNKCAYAPVLWEGTRPAVFFGNTLSKSSYWDTGMTFDHDYGKHIETAGASQNTIVIPHNLYTNATTVQITPGNNIARGAPDFHVVSGATSLTMYFVSDLTNGSSYQFYWRAEV